MVRLTGERSDRAVNLSGPGFNRGRFCWRLTSNAPTHARPHQTIETMANMASKASIHVAE